MKQQTLIDILGWCGVALILGAYTCLSFGFIDAGYLFQATTLIGSLALATETWIKRDRQPAILNTVYATVAAIAIIRLTFFH